MKRLIYSLLLLLCLGACRGHREVKLPAHRFALPTPPVTMSREAQIDYLATHYWDHFNFADTVALVEADTAKMMERYTQFVALLTREKDHIAPMKALMERASASRTTLDYFAFMAEQVLHDPNSPLRSSELYIPVLEAQLKAPYYDTYERIVPEHDLHEAMQNRPGERANDFAFLTREGKRLSLYDLEAEHTLILFSNPECAMCRMLKDLILHSAPIVERITEGRLKMLVLYPDEDLKAWERGDKAPAGWIDARDEHGTIRREGLYDLRAIPSIYLLDRDKRVLVKDSTDPREVEQALL